MIIMVLWVLRRYLTLLLLAISISAAHQEVNEENLRSLLTEEEWKSLFGSSATSPEFAIVRPRRLSRRRRRWLEPEHEMVLEVDAVAGLGRRWELRMRGSDGGLLDPRFVFLRRTGNETEMLGDAYSLKDKDCFYRGGGAALGICDGHTRGIIADQDGHYYVINPLPRRFRRSLEDTPPHVVTRWNLPPALYPHTATDLLEANRHQGRRRRSLPSGVPVYVETAVFIDKDLYRHMSLNFPAPHTERELVRVVLAMINAVQLLYHDPSLGRQVNFVLKRLEILHTDPAALQRPHDIDRFLSSFCLWQRGENPPKDSDPLHWDHALILTGLDLYVVSKNGKVSSQVVGLAPVAGMCTATSSCTVNEGRHFESVYVVAHEIGHNLGMRHDGPLADNECDPGSYIMSPTLGSGKITWSSCSRRYLQLFLETPQSQCLLDHSISGGQLDHSAEGSLPGERFNADQQCMLKYGRGSIHAPEQPLEDVCRDLHCQRDRYTWTSHPALEGTLCGINKWCRSGRCIGRGQSVLQVGTKRIDGAWSNWSPFSECASGCLYSEEGRLHAGSSGIMVSTRRCNNPRPENGGLPCRGSDRRFRTCVAEQCGNVQRTTIRDFADQICIRAREVDSELLGTGLQRISSDSEEACTVWCYKRNGGSKSRGWTFPDGTACQSHRSRYGKSMYCISGRCEEFICDDERYETAATFSLRSELCVRGSSRLQIRSKSRRRDVPQYQRRWSSASGCHFNCLAPGRGLRLVVARDAKCELEETCEPDGSISSVQLCEPDHLSCGRLKTPFEHASTVCSKYRERVRRLSGFGMQISPVAQDPDRPCRVACQDDEVNHRFYLVNGEDGWFPFGTDCSRGMSNKKAYCISGKCLEFGFDDTPLYETEFTLPLLGRLKRSLIHNTTTTVKTTLDKETLERIVASLNFTESSTTSSAFSNEQFSIDLNNPVHIEMKPKKEMTNNSFSNKITESEDLYKHFQRRS